MTLPALQDITQPLAVDDVTYSTDSLQHYRITSRHEGGVVVHAGDPSGKLATRIVQFPLRNSRTNYSLEWKKVTPAPLQ